ncbi:MAG: hypothetical protein U0229_10640 [Anaeromyxobacter sp.]
MTFTYGLTPVPPAGAVPSGRLVEDLGEPAYAIEHAEALAPFLVSVVSDSNPWLFASSRGALTAGRRHPGLALFPYVTEDKLHDAAGHTGPATALAVGRAGRRSLWRPFVEADRLAYRISRRLVKPLLGNRLAFEEENADLGLAFRHAWTTSGRFGLVRECRLQNRGAGPVEVHLLDGLLNLMPADVGEELQLRLSSLVDAYKRTERVPGTTLALVTLAAQVVDLPEPKESLHATTVFSLGLPGVRVHLDAGALERFGAGLPLEERDESRGRRGAYLAEATLRLEPGEAASWTFVADVAQPQRAVVALAEALRTRPSALAAEIGEDVRAGAERLRAIVASTDGLQRTADALASAHHLVNVLFNDLRGGLFAHGHEVPTADLSAFVAQASRATAARQARLLGALPSRLPRQELLARTAVPGDPDLERLALEHLPLTFSRRHGDPSRPWNRFDIDVRDAAGELRLAYQGNWRDIFQNWEALAASHPAFLEGMVARFVNASTADGHNPYRISHRGIDWEVPEPGDPWAAIGYWGDHQLVYLARLVEASLRLHPERLPALAERPIFTYAEVPYRIAPFEAMLADPRKTISFDEARHERLVAREREEGADGRLLHRPGEGGDELHRVTLVEKLLVPALAKLASLVPGGGVWMNTGRPEWNDANNALVGWGLSVVTLCHLERYLALLPGLLEPLRGRTTALTPEVAAWAEATREALERHATALEAGDPGDAARGEIMAALGRPASAFREGLYARGLSAPAPAPVDPLLDLVRRARAAVTASIRANRRHDGLWHGYNLLAPRGRGAFGVDHLAEMLEGQVAVLGAGVLSDAEACALLDALRASRLWREDQRSYLLYPDRALPRFLEKNVVPPEVVAATPGLQRLLEAGGRGIVARDAAGAVRFDERFSNAEPLAAALDALGATPHDRAEVLAAHEATFHHRAFTGRSGSMFAYEGLGSIYWHMVAKLLLAVQERAVACPDLATRVKLVRHARAIRDGLGGVRKGPAGWGAFPLDPYSHTPAGSGARQPGMTGQVKEEVLSRLLDLGVTFEAGRLTFRTALLDPAELLQEPASLEILDATGAAREVEVPAGALAFTLAQVPVVVHRAAAGEAARLVVAWRDGRVDEVAGPALDAARTAALLSRRGEVERLDAFLAIQP